MQTDSGRASMVGFSQNSLYAQCYHCEKIKSYQGKNEYGMKKEKKGKSWRNLTGFEFF